MKKKKSKKEKKLTVKQKYKLERRNRRKLDYEWSMAVKARDNNMCCICRTTGLLHTHHLIPREHLPTRHLIQNGITLCPKHHKYSFEISAHRNAFAFYEWFIANRKDQYDYLLKFMLDLKKQLEAPQPQIQL